MAEHPTQTVIPAKSLLEKTFESGLTFAKGALAAASLGLVGCSSNQMRLYTATREDQAKGLDYDKLDGRVAAISKARDVASNILNALIDLNLAAQDNQTLLSFIRKNPTRIEGLAGTFKGLAVELETARSDPNLVGFNSFGLANKLKNISSELLIAGKQVAEAGISSPLSPSANKTINLLGIDARGAYSISKTLRDNLEHDRAVLSAANYNHKRRLEAFKQNAARIEEYEALADKLNPVLEMLDKAADPKIDYAYLSSRPAEKLELMNSLWNSEQLFRGLAKAKAHDYFLISSPASIADNLAQIRETLRDPEKFVSQWKWRGSRPYKESSDDWALKDHAWSTFQSVERLQKRIDSEAAKLAGDR